MKTPSGKEFKIVHINSEKIIVETGKKPSRLKIPVSALEEIPDFLRGKGWVKIGAIHEISSNEVSLDSFLKKYSHGTSLAAYVAPLLELAGIAEICRLRPAKIRLRECNEQSYHQI